MRSADGKAPLGVRLVLAVAVLNLAFLFSELALNLFGVGIPW